MMTQDADKKRQQIQMFCMDDMVPQDHLLRQIEETIDWSFIYDLVRERYSPDNGRPSMDPVTLIKLPIIQYLYGIRSMRQTIREIEVNVAYRWFLGLEMYDPVPHFTTFGKNYTRRFKGTDLFEQIFAKILEQCIAKGYVDKSTVFIDATHIKAAASNKRYIRRAAHEQARFYEESLREEINKDREEHGKRPLRDKDDGNDPPASGSGKVHEVKESTTDPESGWFHKGEHKEVFAYSAETACDKNGWILGYTIHPGNEHDSKTFPALYEKIKCEELKTVVADAGYKTPAIAKLLIEDDVTPVFPYKRPYTKKGFFKKQEFVYDEDYDIYLCPHDEFLRYSTTNKEGYREYKSDPLDCIACPDLCRCTLSKSHQKLILRHVWEDYMEQCEEIRCTLGMKELYDQRKETIERLFGSAKEYHGMRYAQMLGKAKMEMKVGLTYACMNMKKLVKMVRKERLKDLFYAFFCHSCIIRRVFTWKWNKPALALVC